MSGWFIYGLADVSGRIRYVGYSMDANKRYLAHMKKARGALRLPVYDWIRSVVAAGELPRLVVLETGSGEGWKVAERAWIAYFGRANLLNMTDGGDASSITADARKRAGEKMRGKPLSPEHRKKISDAKRGKPRKDAEKIAEIGRRAALAMRGTKLNISDDERKARSARARSSSSALHEARRASMTPERVADISRRASEQMKRVWMERKNG